MLFLIFLFILNTNTTYADIIHINKPDDIVDENNIFITSLWVMSVFASTGLISKFKSPGVDVEKLDKKYLHWDFVDDNKEYFKLEVENYDKIKDLRKQLKQVDKMLLCLEKGSKGEINEDITYKFGKGPIRFIEDNKYYHGVNNTNEKRNRKGKIIENEGWSKCMFEYTSERKMKIWDTKNINDYCCNCSFDKEKTKGRRVFKVYKCNGHLI
tara:strand:- start:1222 stop:1857 length:636 start_codon:yes stop_codon:yes gene_type:complete